VVWVDFQHLYRFVVLGVDFGMLRFQARGLSLKPSSAAGVAAHALLFGVWRIFKIEAVPFFA